MTAHAAPTAIDPRELRTAKGFGFVQSKPCSAFTPVAVTPDELGTAFNGAKVGLPILTFINGQPFGRPIANADMTFDFPTLIMHAAKTCAWSGADYRPAAPDRNAKANDPSTWSDHSTSVALVAAQKADGIGFMLKDCDIAAFDVDDCRHPESGEISDCARALVLEAASYTEVTVSGTGLRIIGIGTGRHIHRNQAMPGTDGGRIETYRRATRYIVVTGAELDGLSTGHLSNIDKMIDRVVGQLDGILAVQTQRSSQSTASRSVGSKNCRMAALPVELGRLIREGVPPGQRSSQFHHAVGWLKQLNYSPDAIEQMLASNPAGIAEKYAGRLRQEVDRCFRKTDGSTQQAAARTGEDAEPNPPIPLRWHGDANPFVNRRWLVRDLIPEIGKGLLPGQWGTGKTFVALDLSTSVMTGAPFAGRPVDRRGGVLFIAPEGAYEIPIRLSGIVESKVRGLALAEQAAGSLSIDPDRLPIAWTDSCPPLIEPDSIKKLLSTAEAAAARLNANHDLPLGLIVIDTMAAGAGFNDENSASENQRAMNVLERLSRETGAFVLGVDHFGKIVETGTRGSSAKEAAADVVLAMLADRHMAGNISNTRMAVRKLRGASRAVRCRTHSMSSRSAKTQTTNRSQPAL
jgi:hypothetical protein